MKEITIAEGIKIFIDEDCDRCKSLSEENNNLTYFKNLIFDINNFKEKQEKNTWDKGYNQCLKDIKKLIEKKEQF